MKKFSNLDPIPVKHIKKDFEYFTPNKNKVEPNYLSVDNIERTEVSNFFSKIFESREMAHVYHLQVKGDVGSNAKHQALGDYYEGVLNMLDDLIEVYQGQYYLIEDYQIIDTSSTKTIDPIEYFQGLAECVKSCRYCINEEDTHLHSIIDDIVCLIYKTLYKLKYLK